ncbi:MAG: hypothetical protein ACE5QV_09140 [Fidelibacterota bacterium]
MIRFLLLALLFYIGYRVFKNLFSPNTGEKTEIKGEAKGSENIDIEEDEIEDAEYDDLP